MADPDVDDGLIKDDDGFLSIESPYLNFGFSPEKTLQTYVNRIAPMIAGEMEYRLDFMIGRNVSIQKRRYMQI